MTDIQCLDKLTIQAIIDGEETDKSLTKHLNNCPACQVLKKQVTEIVKTSDGLKIDADLSAEFYENLMDRIEVRPFPIALLAAVLFGLVLFSAYLLDPGYISWWFTVGITHQVGLIFDIFFDLLVLSQALGPLSVITVLSALVAIEVLILNKLRIMEGYRNG